jgi:hypothetical protein
MLGPDSHYAMRNLNYYAGSLEVNATGTIRGMTPDELRLLLDRQSGRAHRPRRIRPCSPRCAPSRWPTWALPGSTTTGPSGRDFRGHARPGQDPGPDRRHRREASSERGIPVAGHPDRPAGLRGRAGAYPDARFHIEARAITLARDVPPGKGTDGHRLGGHVGHAGGGRGGRHGRADGQRCRPPLRRRRRRHPPRAPRGPAESARGSSWWPAWKARCRAWSPAWCTCR